MAFDIDAMYARARQNYALSKSKSVKKNVVDYREQSREVISLKKIVGGGYNEFWNFKGRYRVCKGSRASKKSKTTALWVISQMMKMPLANTLVIRKYYSTLRDSFYKELKWAINTLHASDFWKCTENPLELTYLPTNQKILFRGLT